MYSSGTPSAMSTVATPRIKSCFESVGVSLAFWGVQGVSFALGLSGRVPPWVAAWAPNVLFLAAGLFAVRRTR